MQASAWVGRRRRDGVRSSKPVRISNTVTDVVQIDSDGWASSQSTTTVSGSERMSANSCDGVPAPGALRPLAPALLAVAAETHRLGHLP